MRRVTCVLVLLAAIFHLWDGRRLEARQWIRHGEEYVVTLADGATVVLRQQEVRMVTPVPASSETRPR